MILLATILLLRTLSQSTEAKKEVTAYEGYADKHHGVMGWIGYAA